MKGSAGCNLQGCGSVLHSARTVLGLNAICQGCGKAMALPHFEYVDWCSSTIDCLQCLAGVSESPLHMGHQWVCRVLCQCAHAAMLSKDAAYQLPGTASVVVTFRRLKLTMTIEADIFGVYGSEILYGLCCIVSTIRLMGGVWARSEVASTWSLLVTMCLCERTVCRSGHSVATQAAGIEPVPKRAFTRLEGH